MSTMERNPGRRGAAARRREGAAGESGAVARRLMRALPCATLASALADDGWPYASLVLVACRHDASPLLLLSDLAAHTGNIAADARVSLLFDGTEGRGDRLGGARLTVLGTARPSGAPGDRERFLARHASAAAYAGLGDFRFFHVEVERAHLVAGYGRIAWIDRADLLLSGGRAALRAREADIVAQLNREHGDALALCATRLLGRPAGAWRMTGCDPEGCDLALEGMHARLDFDGPVAGAAEARARLAALLAGARASGEPIVANAEGGWHGQEADPKRWGTQAP